MTPREKHHRLAEDVNYISTTYGPVIDAAIYEEALWHLLYSPTLDTAGDIFLTILTDHFANGFKTHDPSIPGFTSSWRGGSFAPLPVTTDKRLQRIAERWGITPTPTTEEE